MPFYPKLRFRTSDSALEKSRKKRVITNIKKLRLALDVHIKNSRETSVSGNTVRIATWNIREFGKKNYDGRSYEDFYYMAEIISRFDLVALQEIRGDLTEFRELLEILGPQWDFIATDVTDGAAGNGERMVFTFNRDKVQFQNIAGELTLKENQKIRAYFGERIKLENGIKLDLNGNPDLSGDYDASTEKRGDKYYLAEDLEIKLESDCKLELPEETFLTLKKGTEIERPSRGVARVVIPSGKIEGEDFGLRFPEGSFDDSLRQFARTPYLISFQLGWLKLNLCTVHIYYGDNDLETKMNQRKNEIQLLTQALANKAENEFKDDKESFLGVLGDFNIIGKDHPTLAALESNDFYIPEKLKSIPGSNVERDKAYDQIAFWLPKDRQTNYSKLEVTAANIFDFFEHVYRSEDEQTYRDEGEDFNGLKPSSRFDTWKTYKMSDHLPMWVEIRNDFSDEYLAYLEKRNV
jgi:hypothetical protein